MNKEFSASAFVQDSGWDFSSIEDTARLGVSEVDSRTIQEMGFGEQEVSELLAFCRARVDESKRLYLVSDGDAEPANSDAEWDGETSVLCWAADERAALVLAGRYDQGKVQPDNRIIDGRAVACLS